MPSESTSQILDELIALATASKYFSSHSPGAVSIGDHLEEIEYVVQKLRFQIRGSDTSSHDFSQTRKRKRDADLPTGPQHLFGSDPDEAEPITPTSPTCGSSFLTVMGIDQECCTKLDEVFFTFLARICANFNATTLAGEKYHQTLVAKKATRSNQPFDFTAFKFRIQPFTKGFLEALQDAGHSEVTLPEKQVKAYLCQQRYIQRFNEDGKKTKSKGAHVWIIEGRRTHDGGWMFKEAERKMCGEPNTRARVGVRYAYEPKVFDPLVGTPKAVFHSPSLPEWLKWERNVLTGIPNAPEQPVEIAVCATYFIGEACLKMTRSFWLEVAPEELE
ncbi:hypothetical protein BJ742DRAFT_788964 [Cladochytrium replicatum]|nr:hypothetical protein BJ742DRAFT_788964 [Cladochytrium replicatum]